MCLCINSEKILRMFKFKVDNHIIKKAEELVNKYNFGKRKEANGTKEQQITGLIGEIMIRELFKAGQIDGSKGFDGGFDILESGKYIDVKTMGRTVDPTPSYVNNFMELQLNHKADNFIFTSYNKKTKELTVCGFISKKNFLSLSKYYPKGSVRKRSNGTEFKTFSGLYEIQNKYLTTTNSPYELVKQIKQ